MIEENSELKKLSESSQTELSTKTKLIEKLSNEIKSLTSKNSELEKGLKSCEETSKADAEKWSNRITELEASQKQLSEAKKELTGNLTKLQKAFEEQKSESEKNISSQT